MKLVQCHALANPSSREAEGPWRGTGCFAGLQSWSLLADIFMPITSSTEEHPQQCISATGVNRTANLLTGGSHAARRIKGGGLKKSPLRSV